MIVPLILMAYYHLNGDKDINATIITLFSSNKCDLVETVIIIVSNRDVIGWKNQINLKQKYRSLFPYLDSKIRPACASCHTASLFNFCPAEPGYALPLQTVQIQISWLLKKPTDLLDLHCLLLSM